MKVWLFLDDERSPAEKDGVSWIVFRTVETFLSHVTEHGLSDGISFDHDLGTDKNGNDAAKGLIELFLDGAIEPKNDFTFYVHSQNPIGAVNIRSNMQYLIKLMKN